VKNSEYVYRQLRKLHKVQRRMDLLKPILDDAIEGIHKLAAAVEASEKDQHGSQEAQGIRRVRQPDEEAGQSTAVGA
jgi:hypothetical protein